MDQKIENLIEFLQEVSEEEGMPRNVKLQIAGIVDILKGDAETTVKVHEATQILEELNEDSNIESHVRTQLYSIVPLLENLL